jgi:hypothetical protein
MLKKKVVAIVIKRFALLAVLEMAHHAMAQDATTPYPNMAPIDQYLMADQGGEITLARSAAPESISGGAEVTVLRRPGFETAVKGKNGFVCIVNVRGLPQPTLTFGIRKCGPRFVITRQPRVPSFHATSKGPS